MCHGRWKGLVDQVDNGIPSADLLKGSRAHLRVNNYTDELIFFHTTFHLVFTPTDTLN